MEERIAYSLQRKLANFDVVLDIHTTNSRIDGLAIVASLSSSVKKVIRAVPVRKVAVVPKHVFGGHELLRYHRAGVSLEYGPNKSGKNYKKILKDTKITLRNLGVLPGARTNSPSRELYRVSRIYKVDRRVVPARTLRDFKRVKKGEIIGREEGGKDIVARTSFYPLFVGKGRYPKTLAVVSRKESLRV